MDCFLCLAVLIPGVGGSAIWLVDFKLISYIKRWESLPPLHVQNEAERRGLLLVAKKHDNGCNSRLGSLTKFGDVFKLQVFDSETHKYLTGLFASLFRGMDVGARFGAGKVVVETHLELARY